MAIHTLEGYPFYVTPGTSAVLLSAVEGVTTLTGVVSCVELQNISSSTMYYTFAASAAGITPAAMNQIGPGQLMPFEYVYVNLTNLIVAMLNAADVLAVTYRKGHS